MAGDDDYEVVVSTGSLRPEASDGVVMPHRWTPAGVLVEADFTGGHLYHLAAAGCLLNDVYREAGQMGIGIDGVRVRAHGGFNSSTWSSTGVVYEIDVSSDARSEDIERLLSVVDDVAEIPKALRSGTPVTRLGR
ncbi:MAG: OsmC family protein [Acidimicrobiales bacterium]